MCEEARAEVNRVVALRGFLDTGEPIPVVRSANTDREVDMVASEAAEGIIILRASQTFHTVVINGNIPPAQTGSSVWDSSR